MTTATVRQTRGGAATHRWIKRGLIFASPDNSTSRYSHAALPAVLPRGDGRFDVYYCSRDAESRSHIGRFTFDVGDPQSILATSQEPLLSPGPLGSFDDSGVTPGCVVRYDGRL